MSTEPSAFGTRPERSLTLQRFSHYRSIAAMTGLVFWNSTYIADGIANLGATESSVPDAYGIRPILSSIMVAV
jgi:hypothetical protein